MKNSKMNKKSLKDRKFDASWEVIEASIDGRIDLPSRNIIKPLTHDEISSLLTKKRLELIRIIGKKKPKTIKQLSDYVHRKLPAVDRDIKLLEKKNIVTLKRNNIGVEPRLKQGMLILPLTEEKKFNVHNDVVPLNISSLQKIEDFYRNLGYEGDKLRKMIGKDNQYKKLLATKRKNTRKKFKISELERRKYVLSTDTDYEILDKCKKLEKKSLTKDEKAMIKLVKSQLEADWRKPLIKKLDTIAHD
tara:strand:+ start:1302 stop:2042 length:741 start_codon:yes stop_codon:yes gene_type:complete